MIFLIHVAHFNWKNLKVKTTSLLYECIVESRSKVVIYRHFRSKYQLLIIDNLRMRLKNKLTFKDESISERKNHGFNLKVSLHLYTNSLKLQGSAVNSYQPVAS